MMTTDDVHLSYGRTMHEVQRFEWATLVGVALVKVADDLRSKGQDPKSGPLIANVEEQIRRLKAGEKTLVRMFKKLYDRVRQKGTTFDFILKKAKDDRNHIAHSFLLTVDIRTAEGCLRAITDLSDKELKFRMHYEATREAIRNSLISLGVPKLDIDHILVLIDREHV